jgi:predicted DNA-binding WGR domain protein
MEGVGVDLQCANGHSNKYYRIVQFGTRVFARYGVRGTEGQTTCWQLATPGEAGGFFYDKERAKEGRGYQFINRCGFSLEEGTLDEAEAEYLREWTGSLDLAFTTRDGKGTWIMVYGGEAARSTSPFHERLLEKLLERPHCWRAGRDELLAQVPALDEMPQRGSRIALPNMYEVGRVIGDETQDEIDIVASLFYPSHPNVRELFDAARVMVRAGELHV